MQLLVKWIPSVPSSPHCYLQHQLSSKIFTHRTCLLLLRQALLLDSQDQGEHHLDCYYPCLLKVSLVSVIGAHMAEQQRTVTPRDGESPAVSLQHPRPGPQASSRDSKTPSPGHFDPCRRMPLVIITHCFLLVAAVLSHTLGSDASCDKVGCSTMEGKPGATGDWKADRDRDKGHSPTDPTNKTRAYLMRVTRFNPHFSEVCSDKANPRSSQKVKAKSGTGVQCSSGKD